MIHLMGKKATGWAQLVILVNGNKTNKVWRQEHCDDDDDSEFGSWEDLRRDRRRLK